MKKTMRFIFDRAVLCVTLGFFVIGLSGCVSVESDLEINRYGDATLKEKTMFVRDVLPMVAPKIEEVENRLSTQENASFEKVDGDNSSGVIITKTFNDISDNDISFNDFFISNMVRSNHDSGKYIDVQKTFFITEYDIDFNIALQKDLEYVAMEFSVNIPVNSKNNNATLVDKNHKYTWKITEPNQNIYLNFSVLNIGHILLCIIPTIIILSILLALLIILAVRKSKQSV